MARPRIDDVARRAGVSKTSVSFAFNQPENLNPATRDRILAVATELGYRPSPIAQRLARRRTDQIGLVVPQATHEIFANPFLPELLRGIGDACDPRGISLVIVPPVGGSIERAVEGALVDGLILLGLEPNHVELKRVRRSGVPVVALDVDSWGGEAIVIAIDEAMGGREAARHLYALGHREIAVVLIAEHPHSDVDERAGISARRLQGIQAGFRDAASASDGTPVELRIVASPASEEGGRAAFEELHRDGLPTAIIAITDITAIGIMLAARESQVAVPGELSVVGYDDVPASAWTDPPLTTIHQPIREKGRLAAEQLMEVLANRDGHLPSSLLLPTRLVVRASTSKPRTSGSAEHRLPAGGGGAPHR